MARFQGLAPAAVSPLSPTYTMLESGPAWSRTSYEPPATTALSPQNQEHRELAETHQCVDPLRCRGPKLPAIKGLSSVAEYLPAGRHSHIGGDWWDAFALPDGAIGLAIGDVMGHDLSSAASMGQLRSVLRSCAWTGKHPEPVLARLDELAQAFDMTQFASCFNARFEPTDSSSAGREAPRLHWSNAGHLPPSVLDPSG